MSAGLRTNEQMWAGALVRGKIRGSLNALKLYGHIEGYTETKGFWDSTFYIKGADETARGNLLQWYRKLGKP